MLQTTFLGHFGLGVYVAGCIGDSGPTDRIHAHFIDRAAVVAYVAARLLGVPYSVTAHANDIYVTPVLLDTKIRGADFVVTCTGYNVSHLVQQVGGAPDKVTRIYHGLELERYQPSSVTPDTEPTLVAVGQLKEKKGFLDLLDACRALRDRGVRFQCVIIGEGPQRDELTRRIADLALGEAVHLRGALPHDEVIAMYRRATAFVLPCVVAGDGDRDGIPNVILEAMAMQLPVVSTSHSGIPEVVEDGTTGVLVPPGDSEALTEALVRVLENPDEARTMGLRGRQVVEAHFDVESNVRELYDRFVATGAAR